MYLNEALIIGFLVTITLNIDFVSSKLNYPRVLLPIFDAISINFTLDVTDGGCFTWTSSRRDLILISPIYDDSESECSSEATITVVPRERRHNTAIVLAENILTGEVLRCDIIVDLIDQLHLITTTRELYLEEAPELFEVRAIDSQGNYFTTLEGVEFNWTISSTRQKNEKDKNFLPALRFLSFSESAYYDVPKTLEKFEILRVKGQMVLLEGVNTGTAKVTVGLPYAEYKSVPSIEVFINVLANIIIDPSDVSIMPDDTIEFRILQLKMGKLQEISLSNQYFLEIENNDVASIEYNSVTGLKVGRTLVMLRDRNVPFSSDGTFKPPVPQATLTVTIPYRLSVTLMPYNNWVTVEGEKHEIAFDLYTAEDQIITLGDKYSILSDLDETIFIALWKSRNGSRIYGQAVQEGISQVSGYFEQLSGKAELQVFKELSLIPSKVILPFDPTIHKSQKIQFSTIGGDGSYLWYSSNPKILQINQNGIATTRLDADQKSFTSSYDNVDDSHLTSCVHVKVALTRNTKISRQAEVLFMSPHNLEIIQYNFETSLNDYIHLQIGLYASVNGSMARFSKCDNLDFDFEFSNQIFQMEPPQKDIVLDELAPGACHMVYLRGSKIGTTLLRISYKFMDKILKDEVVLSVFEKLNVLNPIENEVILPIGSSYNVIYVNGPQEIFSVQAELIKVQSYNKTVISASEIEFGMKKSKYAFTILCRKIGKTVFSLNIYNMLSAKNVLPYISTFETNVHCVKPRFLHLYPIEKIRESCPMKMKSALMHLKDREDKFEVEIEIQDAQFRKLMNISSLVLDWELNQGEEKYSKSASYRIESEEIIVEGVRTPGKDILITTISDVSSNFKIRGTVKEYNTNILSNYRIAPESPQFAVEHIKTGKLVAPIIENEISFVTVNSTIFQTDHLNIFLSKHQQKHIPIIQGSGLYETKVSDKNIISLDYDEKQRELIITPLSVGHTRIELIDRCLMTDPAFLSISVVSIGSLRVEVSDKVAHTKSIEATVKLFDSNGNFLEIDPYKMEIYNLKEIIINKEILSVELGEQFNLANGEIRYVITGHNLGETQIGFSAGSGNATISSDRVTIQVFPPLRLYPRNSTLIVGSSVQIFYHGGPHPNVNVAYTIHDQKVIALESSVVVARKLGETKITGKCITINPTNNKEIILSEDTIEIHVIALTNIQIKTPLVAIKSGAIMPAAIWGVPDLSPMVLGTLENMRIIWSTNQPDVIDIYTAFSEAGIEYSENDLVSVRIRALSPGKAKIQATVYLGGGQKIRTAVEVVVLKVLEIESPKHLSMDWIMMPPRSKIQLKANLGDVLYERNTKIDGVVTVTPYGFVRTNDTIGRDLIVAKTHEQTVQIGIEVKNVQYILASLQYPSIKLKQIVEKIPRGMNFILKISLHDNLGNEFSHNIEDINGIKYDLTHKDMVDVQIGNNLTIAINLLRETSSMIAISLKDSIGVEHAEDYIKLSVAESKHVYLTKTTFSVGDIICFDSPLTLSSYWVSSNEQIVSIDKYTGVAMVLGDGNNLGENVAIINGDINGNNIKYDIKVRDADKIVFRKSFDIFTGSTYPAYLVLRNHLEVDKLSNLIAKNISKCSNSIEKIPVKLFTCHLTSKEHQLGASILEHYKVTSIFDERNGSYACQIELTTNFADIIQIVKAHEVHFELKAQLTNGPSDVLTLKFVPGITITPETLFLDNLNQQEIVISGLDKSLQKVELQPSDASIIEIKFQTKVHGSHSFKVNLLREPSSEDQLSIVVHSPVTQQSIVIPILGSSALEKTCSNRPFDTPYTVFRNFLSNMSQIIGLMVTLIAIGGTFIYCCTYRSKTDINAEASVFNNSRKNESPRGPRYPDATYYNTSKIGSLPSLSTTSPVDDTPVYGDTTFMSPQRRTTNRKY